MGLTVGSWDSSSISTLFSSLNNSSNLFGSSTNAIGQSVSTSSSLLSDWYSIKSGSYSKLMKAYYSSDTAKTDSVSDEDDTDLSSTYANASKVKSASDSLKNTTSALMDSKLYTEDNRSDLYSKISDFVDTYNNMITVGSKSESSSISNNISSMKSYASVNKSLLSEVGISIKSSGKLAIDEETFNKSSLSTAQTLFQSRGSLGYQLNALASSTNVYASSQLSTGYNSSGSYNYGTSSTYTSYI